MRGQSDQDLDDDDDDNDEGVEPTNMVDEVFEDETMWSQGNECNMNRAVSFVRHLLYFCFIL